MKLLQQDIEDGNRLHADHEKLMAQSHDSSEPVTLLPRQQCEESRMGYFMKLLEEEIKDGDYFHADHETINGPVSRDSFEPAPAVDNEEEEFETQSMPNLMALWKPLY